MLPPTPTPFPEGVAHFDIPYSLWNSTDSAIHAWRWLGDWGQVLQVMILIGLVIAGMFIVSRFVQQFTRRDAEE